MSRRTFDPDSALVHLYEFFCNCQTQAGSVLTVPGQVTCLYKSVEDFFHILFAQARPVVCNGYFNMFAAVFYGYIDLAAGGDKFDGVADKICQYLYDSVFVGVYYKLL